MSMNLSTINTAKKYPISLIYIRRMKFMKNVEIVKTDVLIIGTEGAGARAAIEVCQQDENAKVIGITKGFFTHSGATLTAGASINMDGASMMKLFGFEGRSYDNKDIYFEDTVKEGRFVNNQELVQILVDKAPEAVKEVADWGMKVDGHWRGAGHRYDRSILSPGVRIMVGLRKKIREFQDRICLHENIMAVDLIKDEQGYVSGVIALDLFKGDPVIYIAKATILATGGGLRIYPWTSGPEELTGDGQAMAYRAGVEFTDMEFIQFITCTLKNPPSRVGSVNRFLHIGAWLLNKEGQRFMSKWDPERMEQSTRDNIAIGIATEILEGRGFEDNKGGHILCSFKHLPDQIITDNVAIYSLYGNQNFKNYINRIVKQGSVICFPACHFYCGGIRINTKCETNIPGLYAAGEICGGMHGANRISGNAITEALVEGKIVGEEVAKFISQKDYPVVKESNYEKSIEKIFNPYNGYNKGEGVSAIEISEKIQMIAGKWVGVIRDKETLNNALKEINKIKTEISSVKLTNNQKRYNKEWIEALQIENMIQTLEMIARSALARKESRGVHYRKDFPKTNNKEWLKNTLLKKDENGNMVISIIPAKITKFKPKGD